MAYLFHDEVKAQGRKNREERVLELVTAPTAKPKKML
jgi:hypothetical protein